MPLFDQLLQMIFLGLVQGISEWLPISSTAHLKLTGYFFGLTVTPLFNIMLHLGTLIVVLLFFRKDIKNILMALIHVDFKSKSGMLIPRIIAASIPTAIISIAYIVFLRDVAATIPIIAVTFLIGATFVYTTKFAKEDANGLSYTIVLLMGAAQGFAIFPGLSRSGITISTALLLGLKREQAFKFSFLLSIPAILGDFIVETYCEPNLFLMNSVGGLYVMAGVITAMIVGYLALLVVSKLVKGRKFHNFAYYTWTLGATLLILTYVFNL